MTTQPQNIINDAPSIVPDSIGSDAICSTVHRHGLHFDPSAYQHFVENCGLSEAQQQELLATIWQIVVAFVDLGFNLHPIQQVIGADTLEVDSSAMLESENISEINNTTAVELSREFSAVRSDS